MSMTACPMCDGTGIDESMCHCGEPCDSSAHDNHYATPVRGPCERCGGLGRLRDGQRDAEACKAIEYLAERYTPDEVHAALRALLGESADPPLEW